MRVRWGLLLVCLTFTNACKRDPRSSNAPRVPAPTSATTDSRTSTDKARPANRSKPRFSRKPGIAEQNYQVGFRLQLLEDSTRPESRDERLEPRRLLVAFWYPAVSSQDLHATEVGDFLRVRQAIPARDDAQRHFLRAAEDSIQRAVHSEVLGQEDLAPYVCAAVCSSREKSALQRLYATTTQSHLNLELSPDGPFPVIVYHPGAGSSYFENYPLLERLASKGFIVVSSSFFASGGYIPRVGTFADSMGDLRFLFSWLSQHKDIDFNRRSLIGYSFGAQVAALYATKDLGLQTVVSMDSTFERAPMDARGESLRIQYSGAPNARAPMLFLTQQAGVHNDWIQLFEGSDRWHIGLNKGGHSYFTFLGQASLALTSQERQHQARSYDATVDRIEQFLLSSAQRGLRQAEPKQESNLVHRGFFPKRPNSDYPSLDTLSSRIRTKTALPLIQGLCSKPNGGHPWRCSTMVEALLAVGQHQDAQALLDSVIREVGEDWSLLKSKARLSLALGHITAAREHLRKSIQQLNKQEGELPPRALQYRRTMLESELQRVEKAIIKGPPS